MNMRTLVLGIPLLSSVALSACAPRQPSGEARAEALYATCASCHGARGEGRPEYEAPAIAGLDEWYVRAQLEKFRSGARGAHADDVQGLRMRPMARQLDGHEDVEILAAYVASLPPANPPSTLGGNAEAGRAAYATCAECHGEDARGNAERGAPPLHRASDWYLLAQLKKFKDGVRGTNPADETGAQMRPMALGLADEQAMRDVIAYIATLPD